MSISSNYEISNNDESAGAPVIKKVTYRDDVAIHVTLADPQEVKLLEPEILEEYFTVYKNYLKDYIDSFDDFDSASTTKEAINSHVAINVITNYFRGVAELANPIIEEVSNLEDEEL